MEILCGILLPLSLFGTGLVFGIKYKFFYILHPIKTIKTILGNQKDGFKSLSLALAGTLGIGNIVGVAGAIYYGGYGSIFWMWISAILAMSLKYAEVHLAIKYRQSNEGGYFGGAPFYIFKGLRKYTGKRFSFFLACAFSIFCVLNSLSTGNLVQINGIVSISPVSPLIFGIAFSIISLLVIIGGKKRISKLNSYLIPVLSGSYVLICLGIIICNLGKMPQVFSLILENAFSLKATGFGLLGFGFIKAMRYGVSRGILSNEAGCGTSPCAHASCDTKNPHSQACLGILEVFIDTILLCSLTAFVIILSKEVPSENAMGMVVSAFERFLGVFGKYFIGISSILFAFATICTQYFYGSESLLFMTRKRAILAIYTVVFASVTIIGAIIPISLMWEISDLILALMTIFNLVCLILLFSETKNEC